MLKQLKKFIINLKDKKSKTIWQDYSSNNTYRKDEEKEKQKIVKEFCKQNNFKILADIG